MRTFINDVTQLRKKIRMSDGKVRKSPKLSDVIYECSLTHHNFFLLGFLLHHFGSRFVVLFEMEKEIPLSHKPHVTQVALIPGSYLSLDRNRSVLFLGTTGLGISDNDFVCNLLLEK